MNKKQWFKQRWEKLGDLTELLKVASPEYRDPDKYLKELILEEEDEDIADRRLRALEGQLLITKSAKMEVELQRVRLERNKMLLNTDWTQVSDAPLSSSGRQLYREYRQYLRDIPELFDRDQILELEVMDFNTWKENKPKYKVDKKLLL